MRWLLQWEVKDQNMEEDYIIPSTFDPRLISEIPQLLQKQQLKAKLQEKK